MSSIPRAPSRTDGRLSLAQIIEPGVLKSIWRKRVRKTYQSTRLPDFVLGHDPLEWVAFDFNLERTIDGLVREVLDGTYRPSPPEIVRNAKSVGLTRPLAFLAPRDQVLYRALVAAAEPALLARASGWARFGRADGEDDGGESPAESGWFRGWLRRQNQLWVMSGTYDLLVETDVSNFFPSIEVRHVTNLVLERSRVDQPAASLLEYMLTSFAPKQGYRTTGVGGLPQDSFDCSRILAHAYLYAVDEEFKREGDEGRFSRWVDDIVIGAKSHDEALQLVRRAQEALERLALYPNSSKTRIVRSRAFTDDYLKEENDYLGEVAEEIKSGGLDVVRFRRRLAAHVRARPQQAKGWSRVLRRYYTTSRQLHDRWLYNRWYDHLVENPESARHIFDYISTFQLSLQQVERLRKTIEVFGGVYEDVDLLALEYLAVAPNLASARLRAAISEWTRHLLDKYILTRPRLAASACLALAKFAAPSDIDWLERSFRDRMAKDTVVRLQATCALVGAGRLMNEDLRELLPRSSQESLQSIEFLQSLVQGDATAINFAVGLVQPRKKELPSRYHIRPRAIFLAPLLRRSGSRKASTALALWARQLRSNSRSMRDRATERWLFET